MVDSMQDNTGDITREMRTVRQSQMNNWETGNKDFEELSSFPCPQRAKGKCHSTVVTISKKVVLPPSHMIGSLAHYPPLVTWCLLSVLS